MHPRRQALDVTKLPRDQRDQLIQELAEAGLSDRQIADKIQVSTTTVMHIRRRLGMYKPKSPPPFTEEQKQTIEKLLADECPMREIADTIGCRTELLYQHYRGRSKHTTNPLAPYRELRKQLGLL